MTVSLTARAKAERRIKEDVAAMDTAIAFLRANDMAETAERLGSIRDYLSRSESYYRRVEVDMQKAERFRDSPLKRADRMWLDITGQRRK